MKDSEAVKAKARIDELALECAGYDKQLDAFEAAFVRKKGLKVAGLADVESDLEFKVLLDEFTVLPEVVGLEWKTNKAIAERRKLENMVIEKALAIAPAEVKDTLRKGAGLVEYRNRLIDVYLRYEVPEGGKDAETSD